MAEPIARRRVGIAGEKVVPMIQVDEPMFFSPPKGLDLTSRLSRVAPDSAAAIENLMLDDATLRSRYGTQALGTVSSDVMAVVGIMAPSGNGYLIRTTTRNIERWDGTAWTVVAANIFTGTVTDYFSFTMFGSMLLIVNGVNKVVKYDLVTGAVSTIDESVPAKHITSFNGRVVLTNTIEGERKPYRVRWSVKNNSDDWTGDGSGYEDLFATPGGEVDEAHGVYPISDDTALIVRRRSIWIMSVTGILLAPHRFSRIYAGIGTRARRSVVMIPGGIALVTQENVLALSPGNIREIGNRVRGPLIASITDYDAVVAKYDTRRKEYRVAIGSKVWRYNFRDEGWTMDSYPVNIRDMSDIEITRLSIPIDSLPLLSPTIDGLSPTAIDDLSLPGTFDGFMFVGY